MASRGAALQALGRLFERGTSIGLGEGTLLQQFTLQGDTDAFEALVARHGPMVLGVCRRGLVDPHDVEDAFQATFLVLVRKAGSLRDAEQLGPWLFGVARKVTARARSQSLRRRAREHPVAAEARLVASEPNTIQHHELRSILDDEINQLPAKYRAPIVLCYLEGLTHDEAASRLGCPVGTVRSRMAWARERLRIRLDRRGFAPSSILAIPVPPALNVSTISAAARAVSGTLSLSTTAVILAQGVTTAMFVKKVSIVASISAICAASLITGGATLTRVRADDGPQAEVPQTKPIVALREFVEAKTDTADPDALPATRAEVRALRDQNTALQKDVRALLKEMGELRKQVEAIPHTAVFEVKPSQAPTALELPAGAPAPAPNEPNSPDHPQPAVSRVPTTVSSGSILAVLAPTRDRILAKSLDPGGMGGGMMVRGGAQNQPQIRTFQLYKSPKGVTITPVLQNELLGLVFEGPKITELAAFNTMSGTWSVHTLADPASGKVEPMIASDYILYPIGRRVYACTSFGKWDSVEFKGKPVVADTPFGPSFQDDSQLFAFDVRMGAWKRIDFDMLAKEAAQKPPKADDAQAVDPNDPRFR